MRGVWWEAHQIQQKQLPGSRGERCPRGFPIHRELLPSKRSFRNGKIRDTFAFFPLPKPTVTVSVERQQKTFPSGS